MADKMVYRADAGWLDAAVNAARSAGMRVIGPKATEPDTVEWAPVDSGGEIEVRPGSMAVPLKQFFMPLSEVLLEYEKKEDGDVDIVPAPTAPDFKTVILGCRPCDAGALDIVDKVFRWDWDDVRYRERRDATTLVTFSCEEPEATCFCTSVGISPRGEYGDVLVNSKSDGTADITALTEKGAAFVELFGAAAKPSGERPAAPGNGAPEARFDPSRVRRWLDKNFESEFLSRRSLGCLGCGACTFLCPTCHCFDIVDEAVWNHGVRRRNWDSCSFPLFTLHASGHNPRPGQTARFRQRIMHKFAYFPDRFGRVACVGCGRCIKVCGAGRDLARTLEAIESLQQVEDR